MAQQIGTWDGVTAQKTLSTPYAWRNMPTYPTTGRSFFLQPWRAYMDTWPTSRLLNGLAINWGGQTANAARISGDLVKAGFSSVRQEFGWGNVDYNNPTSFLSSFTSQWGPIVQTWKQFGIRPLVLINANSILPCPAKGFTVTLASNANIGDTTLTLATTGNFSSIRAGYTGLNNQGFYQTSCPLITNVNGSTGVCALSRPLAKAITAGNLVLQDLLYHPFSAPTWGQNGNCTNGQPTVTGLNTNASLKVGMPVAGTGFAGGTTIQSVDIISPTAGQITLTNSFTGTTGSVALQFTNAFSAETVTGWMAYLSTLASWMNSLIGPNTWDVEIWNELTFGSQFLDDQLNYYNSANTWASPFSYTNATYNKTYTSVQLGSPGPIWGMSTDYFYNNWPGVGIICGFANTDDSFEPSIFQWPGTTGYSRHYYAACVEAANGVYNSNTGPCAPGSGNAAPDYPTQGPFAYDGSGLEGTPNGPSPAVVSGSFFVPTFNLGCPESRFNGTLEITPTWSVQPFANPQGRWRGVTDAQFGYQYQWYQTEFNYGKFAKFNELHLNEGFSLTDPRLINCAFYLGAKSILRTYCFHLHKGMNKIWLFSLQTNPQFDMSLFPDSYFNNAQGSQDWSQYVGKTAAALYNLVQAFKSETDPSFSTALPLTVTNLIEYFPRLVLAGDGTTANPTLTNVDEFAILPFQAAQGSYIIPYYVVTRDIGASYPQGIDDLDTARYTMPDQLFEITFQLPAGSSINCQKVHYVNYYDPLQDIWSRGNITNKTDTSISIALYASDYPRLLYLKEAGLPPSGGKAGRRPKSMERTLAAA